MVNYKPGIGGALAIVAVALLAAASIVRHYRKSAATFTLEREFFLVPAERMVPVRAVPQLFSFPGGLPGNGHSGMATKEENLSDPYRGGDRPGPYGRVNDPYDGDWALNPLGGKQVKMQLMPMIVSNAASAVPDENLWNGAVTSMGTNRIFMHTMNAKDTEAARLATASKNPSGPSGVDTFLGTNQVFFESNGGGYDWALAPRVLVSRQALKDLQSLKNRQVQRDEYKNSGKIGGGVEMVAKYSGPDTVGSKAYLRSGLHEYFESCDPSKESDMSKFTVCVFKTAQAVSKIPSFGSAETTEGPLQYLGKGKASKLDMNGDAFRAVVASTPDENFAWVIFGQFQIQKAGSYELCIRSDDGSKLFLDGSLLVNNDGLHGPEEKCKARELKAGKHLAYIKGFQAGGGVDMVAQYSGPDTNGEKVPLQSG